MCSGKVKVETTVLLFLEILLSDEAWTFEANIFHLDRKAAKGSNCKRVFGQFWPLQWPEDASTIFKRRFSSKTQERMG